MFVLALHQGLPETDARTLTFAALVSANLGLILVNRSRGAGLRATFRRRNTALWWVTSVTCGLLAVIIAFEPARALFHFGPLHADDTAVAIATGVALLVLLSLTKRLLPSQKAGFGGPERA